jgi:hypothetical protein
VVSTTSAEPELQALPSRPMAGRDMALGVVGGAMVIFAVVLLFLGGERDTGAAMPPASVPALEVTSPASGAEVVGPLVLEFSSAREMEFGPGGWGVGDLHIHMDIDGRSFMPSGRDIVRQPNGLYRWTTSLPSGEHSVRLYWAGLDHRALTDGATEPVRVRVP